MVQIRHYAENMCLSKPAITAKTSKLTWFKYAITLKICVYLNLQLLQKHQNLHGLNTPLR